jgi:TPR repeat protein
VLSHYQPPLAREFAARGLERLSAGDFRRDCRLLLQGDSICSECCRGLAASLGGLNDEQVAVVAKLQSPARGEFIRECARRLRAAKDQPMLETLMPALEAYWEQELKGQVAAALREETLDPAEAFKKGLMAYRTTSQDQSEAAKLFRQAAERGHPGAQYYLAMIYELGLGVPKDVAAAMDLYRQSATNGFTKAAAVLGHYYSDGVQVRPDYAEAFVWYSVAAAGGDRLAEVFRKSAQRKLTAQQSAQAQERVEAILASRPKTGYTPMPSETGQ